MRDQNPRSAARECCEVCGTSSAPLRRRRCAPCYTRWSEQRAVGVGAACVICDERRHEDLKLVEFQQRWVPMCHSCSARAFRLSPVPVSLQGLRERLSRDRRHRIRRRSLFDPRSRLVDRRRTDRRLGFVDPHDELWFDSTDIDLVNQMNETDAMEEVTRIR